MNTTEALELMKAGCEVERLDRDPIAIREKFIYQEDKDQVELWLDGFSKGPTDILSPANFLRVLSDAEFVLFEKQTNKQNKP